MKPLDPETIRRILADEEARCKAGLADFIKHCMKDKEPLHWGWHLDLIAEHMEAVAEGRAKPSKICLSRREMREHRSKP